MTNRRLQLHLHFPHFLDQQFKLTENHVTIRSEIAAGITTFLTMAYIIFVNPAILKEAGVPFSGALFATCLAAAIGSLLMGLLANYPFALAPGMGLNAYFTYTVVLGLKHDWRVALWFTFSPLLKLLAGRGREVNWLVYLLAVVFVLRYAYLSGGWNHSEL